MHNLVFWYFLQVAFLKTLVLAMDILISDAQLDKSLRQLVNVLHFLIDLRSVIFNLCSTQENLGILDEPIISSKFSISW